MNSNNGLSILKRKFTIPKKYPPKYEGEYVRRRNSKSQIILPSEFRKVLEEKKGLEFQDCNLYVRPGRELIFLKDRVIKPEVGYSRIHLDNQGRFVARFFYEDSQAGEDDIRLVGLGSYIEISKA